MPLTVSRSQKQTKSNDKGGLTMPTLGLKKSRKAEKTSPTKKSSTGRFFGSPRKSTPSARTKHEFIPLDDQSKDSVPAPSKNAAGGATSTATKGNKTASQAPRTPLSPARSYRTTTTAEISDNEEQSPTISSHSVSNTVEEHESTLTPSLTHDTQPASGDSGSVKEKVISWEKGLGHSDVKTDTSLETLEDVKDADDMSTSSLGSVLSQNFADTVLKLVEDCESRWNAFTKSTFSTNTLGSSTESAPAPPSAVVTEPTSTALIPRSSTDSAVSQLILRQQAEIDYLRERLEEQEQLLQQRSLPALPPPPPAPKEDIESLPMEEVELVLDDNCDVMSVTSCLTHMHDARSVSDDTAVLAITLPLSRPDAMADMEEEEVIVRKTQVDDYPLQLRAANGSIRNALYTGPCKRGVCTGVGVLRFETADVYMGEVVDGKMHGSGTYTFAKQRRGKPKVLRGVFENNVYMGWNPDALRRKLA